jgi:thiamine pyrophosphokinase
LNRRKTNRCLIVCDGLINRRLLNIFLKQNERSSFAIISADGASNFLFRLNIKPDYIIGDLDSIFPEVLQLYKKTGVSAKKIIEQEHNDLEKCISFALSKGIKNITIIGYGGKRIDHTINNFSILKRYYNKCSIRFIDDEFEIFIIDREIEFDYKKGEIVSIQGFPKAEGVVAEGLQFPLNNSALEFGIHEGALNKAISDKVKISIKKGQLIIFKKHFSHI